MPCPFSYCYLYFFLDQEFLHSSHRPFIVIVCFLKYLYLFIWVHRALVATCGILLIQRIIIDYCLLALYPASDRTYFFFNVFIIKASKHTQNLVEQQQAHQACHPTSNIFKSYNLISLSTFPFQNTKYFLESVPLISYYVICIYVGIS